MGVRQIGELLKEIGQVDKRIQSVLFGRLHEAVDDRAGLRAARRIGKQPILSTDNEWFGGAFAAVVVDLQTTVFQKRNQWLPLILAIRDRLSKCAFR